MDYSGSDHEIVQEVLSIVGKVLVKATKSHELDNMIKKKMAKQPIAEIPTEILHFWFVDGEGTLKTNRANTELYDKFKSRMVDEASQPLFTNFEEQVDKFLRRTKTFVVDGPRSQDKPLPRKNWKAKKEELSDYACFFFKQCSFNLLLNLTHLGFDDRAMKAREEPLLWVCAQPHVNDRKVTTERMTSNEKGGLMDVIVGSNLSNQKLTDEILLQHHNNMSTLNAQDCIVSLYALDDDVAESGSSTQQSSVGIESMLNNLVGNAEDCGSGVVKTAAPRGITPEDLFDAVNSLTGVDISSKVRGCNFVWKDNKPKLCLLGFEILCMAYGAFENGYNNQDHPKDQMDKLIDNYSHLCLKSGFPIVNDKNRAAHKYLIPSSLPEVFIRMVFMNLAAVRVRASFPNGQGRVSAIRHTLFSVIPMGKPIACFSAKHGGSLTTYFDKINKSTWSDVVPSTTSKLSTHYAGAFVLPLLACHVRTMVSVVILEGGPKVGWYRSVLQLLLKQSRQDLKALDQAASKCPVDILKDVMHTLQSDKFHDEVSYLAKGKDGTVMAKELSHVTQQVHWIAAFALNKHKECSAMKTSQGGISDFLKSTLSKQKIKKDCWIKSGTMERKKAEERIADLKESFSGYETLHPHMISPEFGRKEEELTQDRISDTVRGIMNEKKLVDLRALLFLKHTENKSVFIPMLTKRTTKLLGRPALPEMHGLVALLSGFLCYDHKSARLAFSFVNNNGNAVRHVNPFVTFGQSDPNDGIRVSAPMTFYELCT